jgi:hypothetical protein
MKAFIAMLSLATLLSAYPALAAPPFGERQPGGRLLEKLIDPCRTSCFDQVRSCRDVAQASALDTIQKSCGSGDSGQNTSPLQAAQIACKSDHTSQACQAARSALRSCAQSALTQLRSALYTCRNPTNVENCVEICSTQ